MERKNSILRELFSWLALAGNLLSVLWISYNGINAVSAEVRVPSKEIISISALMILFILNSFLLLQNSPKKGLEIISLLAIAGNILFMFWFAYSRINENFRGSIYQLLSFIGLMGLLFVTIVIILNKRKTQRPLSKQKIN